MSSRMGAGGETTALSCERSFVRSTDRRDRPERTLNPEEKSFFPSIVCGSEEANFNEREREGLRPSFISRVKAGDFSFPHKTPTKSASTDGATCYKIFG